MEVEENPSSKLSDPTACDSQEQLPPNGVSDIPKVGGIIWVMLTALLLPSLAVALVGGHYVDIPHQTLWVFLLALPVPLILVSLPRSYLIDSHELCIQGWYYRFRIPRDTIVSCVPMKPLKAILHPGSIFCSDPSTALRINRKKGYSPIISPRKPEHFIRFLCKQPVDRKE